MQNLCCYWKLGISPDRKLSSNSSTSPLLETQALLQYSWCVTAGFAGEREFFWLFHFKEFGELLSAERSWYKHFSKIFSDGHMELTSGNKRKHRTSYSACMEKVSEITLGSNTQIFRFGELLIPLAQELQVYLFPLAIQK